MTADQFHHECRQAARVLRANADALDARAAGDHGAHMAALVRAVDIIEACPALAHDTSVVSGIVSSAAWLATEHPPAWVVYGRALRLQLVEGGTA